MQRKSTKYRGKSSKQFHLYFNTGNGQRYFSIDPTTGKLYVTKEIDREALPITNGDVFNLQIEAKQKDNPLKSTVANVCSLYSIFNPSYRHY